MNTKFRGHQELLRANKCPVIQPTCAKLRQFSFHFKSVHVHTAVDGKLCHVDGLWSAAAFICLQRGTTNNLCAITTGRAPMRFLNLEHSPSVHTSYRCRLHGDVYTTKWGRCFYKTQLSLNQQQVCRKYIWNERNCFRFLKELSANANDIQQNVKARQAVCTVFHLTLLEAGELCPKLVTWSRLHLPLPSFHQFNKLTFVTERGHLAG